MIFFKVIVFPDVFLKKIKSKMFPSLWSVFKVLVPRLLSYVKFSRKTHRAVPHVLADLSLSWCFPEIHSAE